MTEGPLHGTRILEFSIILSAPYAGMQLADLGADVIKVEQPPVGDPARNLGAVLPGHSKYFQVLNRGRKSIAVDLSTPEGREVIYRLMPTVDVVLHNFRPGIAEKLGVDYQTLLPYRPDLIFCEIAGFGYEGPMASYAASDIVASGYGGAIALSDAVEADGAPRSNRPPIAGDQPTGLAAVIGILAALLHHERTGEGQVVQTSLLRSVISMTALTGTSNGLDPVQDPRGRDLLVEATRAARERGASYEELLEARRARQRPNLYFRAWRAKDGGLVLGALTPANRAAIRGVLGLEGADTDEPGFSADDPDAIAALYEREREIGETLLTRTVAEWFELFNAAGAPISPVNFPEDLIDDPQAAHHFAEVEHPVAGTTKIVRPMMDLSKTPSGIRWGAPKLGQHNDEVLEAAGYTPSEIEALLEQGVLAAEP